MKAEAVKKPLITGAAFIIVFLILSAVLPQSYSNVMSNIMIMMLFATSVNVMFGYGGLIAFGQAIFFGSGAYIYTILIARASLSHIPAFLLTLVMIVPLAYLLGKLTLRVQSLTFGLLFLGLNILFYDLSIKVPQLGSGSGIAGALRPKLITGTKPFFYFVMIIVAICYAVIYVIMHSSFANMARGIRENEERMSFIGVDIKKTKLCLILISSFFCGVAGILYAMLNLGAYTTYLNVNISTQGLIMCLVGGMSTFWGPSLGAILITVISVSVSNFTIYYNAILGIILIVTILFFPGGLLGTRADDRKRARVALTKMSGVKEEAVKTMPEQEVRDE